MKFKNEKKDKLLLRLGNNEWINLKPNEVIDLSEEYGLKLGLTKVEEKKEALKSSIAKKKVETKVLKKRKKK